MVVICIKCIRLNETDFNMKNQFWAVGCGVGWTTDYGRPERKWSSLHGRKFNPNPKFLGTAEAYFVCHINPNFQISLIYAFIGCPYSVVQNKNRPYYYRSKQKSRDYSLIKGHTLCCNNLRSFACLPCKMPMSQRVGMRVGEGPLPVAFKYLILMI